MNLPHEESMRIPRNAKIILNRIESNANNSELIDGLSFLGSYARGEASFYSDIDLVALMVDDTDYKKARIELLKGIQVTNFIRKKSKYVLYLSSERLKVELTILKESEIETVEIMFKGSRIASLDNSIIIDKTGKLRTIFKDWVLPPGGKPSSIEVNEEAKSFLYYYESMNVPLARGDTYRAYFLYSLMYFKLAAIICAYLGKGDFLYEPEFLISALKKSDHELSTRFNALLPTLRPPDLNEKKEKAMDLFIEISTNIPSIDQSNIDLARTLKKFVSEKYPYLWKLRDLGYGDLIRPGKLYRSARLTVYNTDILLKWITRLNLKTIVDLRRTDEVEIDRYELQTLSSVNYVHSPVMGNERNSAVPEMQGTGSVDLKIIDYDTATKNKSFKNAVKVVFTLLSDADNFPLLFHCTAGSDRTGRLAALIEGMMGVPNDVIITNYLASSTLLKPEYIITFLKRVEENGGYFKFIEESEVSKEIIINTKGNLSNIDYVPR
jgi:protein-tyrosine phosphatase